MDRNYECMLILKPDLPEAEREEAAGSIEEKIKELGGEVVKSLLWAKVKDFYYFLRSKGAERKKYHKGSYWLINFALPIENLGELKEAIRLEEKILRSLILNKEGDKVKVSKSESE